MNGLRIKRKERKLTLEALAKALGLSMRAIYWYEKGQRFPRKENLDKLCKFFDCKIDDLL